MGHNTVMNEQTNLSTLEDKYEYAAWVQHMAHDKDRDAWVVRAVVLGVFSLSGTPSCYGFSTTYDDSMGRTGLNMHDGP